ncbi:MAG: histidine phosphatase family protein [Clostridia bacterium]|nr:histidine phosphatase family protein [Clostridia bacterium]
MIYLVRHSQTDWNLKKIYQGQTDIELNIVGIKQAEELAKKLDGIYFDIVFSSPLKRAIKTAEIISNGKIVVDNRLIERFNGELEGKEKRGKYIIDFANPDETKFGIEPLPIFKKRIFDFWNEIVKTYHGKNILVVTHSGVVIYSQEFFKGEPENLDYSKYKIKNSDFLQFENNKFINNK